MSGCHPSHTTRSSDASSFDEICTACGATDIAGAGWGKLAEPCPKVTEKLTLRDVIANHLAKELNCAYDCIRVWEAWSVGTMSQDDFLPVEDRIDEIVDGLLREIEVTPEMQRAIWAETAMDNIPRWHTIHGRTDTKAFDAWFIKNFRPVQTFPTLNAVFAAQHQDDPVYQGA